MFSTPLIDSSRKGQRNVANIRFGIRTGIQCGYLPTAGGGDVRKFLQEQLCQTSAV